MRLRSSDGAPAWIHRSVLCRTRASRRCRNCFEHRDQIRVEPRLTEDSGGAKFVSTIHTVTSWEVEYRENWSAVADICAANLERSAASASFNWPPSHTPAIAPRMCGRGRPGGCQAVE